MGVLNEPPDIAFGRPVEQVLSDLETRAAASLVLQAFVSGTTRIDCEYVPRDDLYWYYVNGRADSREEAAQAIERAREAWHRQHG